jgi:hypothetical protein
MRVIMLGYLTHPLGVGWWPLQAAAGDGLFSPLACAPEAEDMTAEYLRSMPCFDLKKGSERRTEVNWDTWLVAGR